MNNRRVLYFTDGHDVIITDADFQVKGVRYPLGGIFSQRVSLIEPHRIPFAVLTIIGTLVFFGGAFDMLPQVLNKPVSILGVPVFANALIMILGTTVMILGLFAMFHLRERYAVNVSTSEGEKTALVSDKREYASQIVDALNHAHLDLMQDAQTKKKRK